MAYTPMPAKSSGNVFSLTDYDNIKGNFEAGVPDAFTAKGDLFAGTGIDAGARLAVGADECALVADSSQTTGLAWQIQPAARVYASATLTLDTNTWTTVLFAAERYDTDAMHSTATNTGRMTIPTGGAGIYTLGACVEFNSNQIVIMRFLLNGTTSIAKMSAADPSHTGLNTCAALVTEYALSEGDYVEVQVYSDSAVTTVIEGNSSPEFWARWVRRAGFLA